MTRKHKLILFHVGYWILNTLYGFLFWGITIDIAKLYMIIPFYINYFVLVPKLLVKNKPVYMVIWFVLVWSSSIGTFMGYYFVMDTFVMHFDSLDYTRVFAIGGYVSFYYISISTGVRLLLYWMSNIKHNHRLNLKKTEAQFQLMKSNINIPFMLDALNYTESIAKESPGNAEEPIILLSNVLRYGLYETQSTFIPLYRELEVLEEYILLQNQIDRQCTLKLNTLSLLENVPIVPNILVRFVGYWKHIMDNRLEGQQQINIFAEHNTLLMNLPLSPDIDNLKNLLEKRFPIFQDVNFVVTYFINNESLVLKIVNLAK